MANVIAETIDIVREKFPFSLDDVKVEDLVIGVFFTGVKLSNGRAGVAFTPIGEMPEAVCCPTTAARMPQAGKLEGRSASEILTYALDANVLKSAMGIATLNALSQTIFESINGMRYEIVTDVDGFDLLQVRPHETVTLIGAFVPYIKLLKSLGNPFFIVEKNPQTLKPDEIQYYKPESEMKSALERSEVVVMTGTAIVNHTIDAILSLISEGKRTAIIGPTASMVPDAFFERSVDVMAGVRILDPETMIKILKQAGSGYHLLRECSEKINLVRK